MKTNPRTPLPLTWGLALFERNMKIMALSSDVAACYVAWATTAAKLSSDWLALQQASSALMAACKEPA